MYLGYKIGETTVKNILLENGYDPEPDLTRKTTRKGFLKSHWSVLAVHAEGFIRFIKEECLDHLILSSEDQLRHALGECLTYRHHERIHQGPNRIIEPQHEGHQGKIICMERPGGLLRSYHRQAA